MSLSSLLVQREVATIRDVEEALARQVLYGGDLVTNLLESANIDERKLSDVLGESTHLRPAGAGALPEGSADARAMVPVELAQSRGFVPLALTQDGEQLIVAIAEPLSVEEEEKTMFDLGIPIVQRVAPMVRVREAIARDYGLPLERRFERLLRRMRGEQVESMSPPGVRPKARAVSVPPAGSLPPTASKAPPTVANPQPGPVPRTTIAAFPAPQRVEGASPPSNRNKTPSSSPTRTLAREAAPAGARPQRRPRRPLTFDAAKRELDASESRDELIDLFFDFSRQYYDYSALFVVHGDIAEGRDAFGSGASRDRVATVGVPLDLPSLLSVAKERAMPVLAMPSEEGIDAMLLNDLSRSRKGEVIVVPLVVRRRTVALLYGDDGDSGVPIENPSDVTTFALLVGQAFERIIVKKKLGSSDRALPRVVHVPAREASTDDRRERARVLSRALQDAPPPSTPPSPAGAEPESPAAGPETSPVAISVPPPLEGGSAPPPANVLLVRRPSGPPIPREDPVDPTTRPPEQVFPRSSRPPPSSEEPAPTTLASPTPTPAEPTRPLGGSVRPAPIPREEPEEEVSAPARIEAEELSPAAAREVLAAIEQPEEEIEDDMIEESSPVSAVPPSQTIVVAPRRPPTSRTDTENLPTIIVDVSAELEVLVRDIVAGKNEERAEEELLRQGAAAMPAILASFPGPTRNAPTAEQETFPPFSSCGPVLRLIASQRKVALPYVLPLATDDDEERRFWGTYALTELAYPEATPVLVPRLFDESTRVRRAARLAIAAISRAHGEHVARELGRYARDTHHERGRRLNVLRLLEDVREPMAVPTFIALLEDADRTIGSAALHALEVITRQELGGDPKKWKSWWNANSSRHRIEWLIDALMHESLPVRKAASDELKAITKEYFGYYADESKRDREKAQARYREWWGTEGRLKFVVA